MEDKQTTLNVEISRYQHVLDEQHCDHDRSPKHAKTRQISANHGIPHVRCHAIVVEMSRRKAADTSIEDIASCLQQIIAISTRKQHGVNN